MSKILASYFKKLSFNTQILLVFFICNLVCNIVLSLVLKGQGTLHHTRRFLIFSQTDNDSWGPMFKALEYLRANHEVPIYSGLFFNDGVKFQYPLTSLLPLQLLEQNPSQLSILKVFMWIAIITTAIFAIKIFNISSNRFSSQQSSRISRLDNFVRSFILLSLCIMFYPVVKAYSLGQVQVFINCFFTLAVWFWIKQKENISGILIGLVLLLKPQYSIIAVWAILRKRFSFLISLLVVFLSGLLYSVFLFGISNNLDYLRVLQFISRTGEGYYPNQSMNGFLNRLLFNGNNLQWEPSLFAPFNPIVYGGTLLISALLILSAFFLVRKNMHGNVIDFMIIALSCTIASPVAWEHHYGILLVIFAFLLPYLLSIQSSTSIRPMFFFALAYTLASNYLPIFNLVANVPVLNIVQSYLFIAALIVLVFLYGIRDGQVKTDNPTD